MHDETAGVSVNQQFVDELQHSWHKASEQAAFRARSDYGVIAIAIDIISREVGAVQPSDESRRGHLDADDERQGGGEHWPIGHEPMRMDVHPADSPEVVARPNGTVRVFNVPAANAVVLDVAQPLTVNGATRAISYFSPADARALGEELLAAGMAAERYAREGYR